jgi:hypothetical protein
MYLLSVLLIRFTYGMHHQVKLNFCMKVKMKGKLWHLLLGCPDLLILQLGRPWIGFIFGTLIKLNWLELLKVIPVGFLLSHGAFEEFYQVAVLTRWSIIMTLEQPAKNSFQCLKVIDRKYVVLSGPMTEQSWQVVGMIICSKFGTSIWMVSESSQDFHSEFTKQQ